MTGTKKNQISGKNVIVPATGDVHFLIQLTCMSCIFSALFPGLLGMSHRLQPW